MRLKTKLALAGIGVATAVTVGTVLIIRHSINRRRHAHDFLPSDARESLRELCSLKGDDFIPDGLGSSLYQRKLASMTDRELVGVYIAIKLAETLRARGIDPHQMSKASLIHEAAKLHAATKDKDMRHELLKKAGSVGVETARSILSDGLVIAGAIA